jgi:hypothetical protein
MAAQVSVCHGRAIRIAEHERGDGPSAIIVSNRNYDHLASHEVLLAAHPDLDAAQSTLGWV